MTREPTEMERRVMAALLEDPLTKIYWSVLPSSRALSACIEKMTYVAIRAMREPTDDMLWAVDAVPAEGLSYANGFRTAYWTAMIDAASPPITGGENG